MEYKAAVTYFEWMGLSSMSKKVVDSYKEKEGVIERIRSVGYRSFQVKRLNKDGIIKKSQIIKLD